MSGIYYAAVEDDPLTSGNGSRVYSYKQCGTIQGEDGKRRRMAFIGDTAYCVKCNSTGLITYGSGLGAEHRLLDLVNGGRRQAVGGDIVLCKCADHPRIIATYGRNWIIRDRLEEKTTSPSESPAQRQIYDEQYTLADPQGRPLAGIRYRVRVGAQIILNGVSDAAGKTQRIPTAGMKNLVLDIAH